MSAPIDNSDNSPGGLGNTGLLNNNGVGNGNQPSYLSNLINSQGINLDPQKQPPVMKTLVYSPDIRVVIATTTGQQYDVSTDVVRGQLFRRENSASTFVCELANKNQQYTKNGGLFSRMDRITVYMKRVNWVQVFTGYLDTVPFAQMWAGNVNIKATCTLKRLLYTYWNPNLAPSQAIFSQLNMPSQINPDIQSPALADQGIGDLLGNLVCYVGGWQPQNVHIQDFPWLFFYSMEAEFQKIQLQSAEGADDFRTILLGYDHSAGVGSAAGQKSLSTGPGLGPQVVGALEYKQQIIQAVDDRSMGPRTVDIQNSYLTEQLSATGQGTKEAPVAQAFEQNASLAEGVQTQARNSDAAILAFACVTAESGWLMLANATVPESLNFYNEGLGADHDSIGLFQQRNQGWGCLPADSQVFTSHGPQRIVDVKVGDEVWSFDGQGMRLGKVTDWMMTGHKPLLTIRTAGRALEVTDNHWIPVRRYFGSGKGSNQFSGKKSHWKTIEVQAGEIRPGDYLIVPHGMGDGNARTTPDGFELTESTMELVGLYLGDGNCDRGRIEISHGHGVDEDHMPYYRTLIERELGVTPYTDKRGTRTRFSSPPFRKLIADWFGGTAHTKSLPEWTYRLTPNLQLALLRGYLDSDGSVDALGRISWSSVSPSLIEGVRHLCILLGIPVGKVSVRSAKKTVIRGKESHVREAHSLRLSSAEENKKIAPHSPHKLANIAKEAPRRAKSRYNKDWNSSVCRRVPMGAPPKGTVYHRVISVTQGTEVVPVYDITVDGLHHYVADGIVVHNTVAQRMNAYASAGMFLDELNKFDWRNMEPSEAIAQVQRNRDGAVTYAPFIAEATQEVSGIRAGQGKYAPPAAVAGVNMSSIEAATTGQSIMGIATGSVGVPGVSQNVPAPGALPVNVPGRPQPDSQGAILAAQTMLAQPYRSGGKTPGIGFDAAGLISYAFNTIGRDVGTTLSQQSTLYLQKIDSLALAQPGDVIQTNGGAHAALVTLPGVCIQALPGVGVVEGPITFSPTEISGIYRYADYGGPGPAPFNPAAGPGLAPGVGSAGGGLLGGTGSDGQQEPVARNLFSYIFTPARFAAPIATLFSGEKSFIDSQPLIQEVQAVSKAGLRNFASAPNGDFIAYYPDHFGVDGKPVTMTIEDIEMKDVRINLSDDSLTTHVYITGDQTGLGQISQPLGWLLSAGVATVENETLFQRLRRVVPGHVDDLSGGGVLQRYGVRPIQMEFNMVCSHKLEFLVACQIFMQKWAEQYETTATFTFMPELFPGMRVALANTGIAVYISEVTHCLRGSEKYLTKEGTKTLAETAGTTQMVLGAHGEWTPAEIKSFGNDELCRIVLTRYGRRKELFATAPHRWFKKRKRKAGRPPAGESKWVEVTTENLSPGDILRSVYKTPHSSKRLSPVGVQAGIVFGDGTIHTSNNTALVRLYGEKDAQLLKWFPLNFTTHGVHPDGNHVPFTEVKDLPTYFKSPPPLNEAPSYLRGWLAGYFAADGNVTTDEGSCQAFLTSVSLKNIQIARDVCHILGIRTTSIVKWSGSSQLREELNAYRLQLDIEDLSEDFFLIEDHRIRASGLKGRWSAKGRRAVQDWKVESIERTGITEEVFCAVVPKGHAFVLDDNLLTGNSFDWEQGFSTSAKIMAPSSANGANIVDNVMFTMPADATRTPTPTSVPN